MSERRTAYEEANAAYQLAWEQLKRASESRARALEALRAEVMGGGAARPSRQEERRVFKNAWVAVVSACSGNRESQSRG